MKHPREYMTVWNEGHSVVTEKTRIVWLGGGVERLTVSGKDVLPFQARHNSLPVAYCQANDTLYISANEPKEEKSEQARGP